MCKYLSAVLTLFIIFSIPLPGYAIDKALEAEISRILEENNTTAASIAIIEADGSWHALGIGIRDRRTEKPVDADTLFRIGSVSKIFFHYPFLKLVEEDKLAFMFSDQFVSFPEIYQSLLLTNLAISSIIYN